MTTLLHPKINLSDMQKYRKEALQEWHNSGNITDKALRKAKKAEALENLTFLRTLEKMALIILRVEYSSSIYNTRTLRRLNEDDLLYWDSLLNDAFSLNCLRLQK